MSLQFSGDLGTKLHLEIEADGLVEANQLRINLRPKCKLLHVQSRTRVKECSLLCQSYHRDGPMPALHFPYRSAAFRCFVVPLTYSAGFVCTARGAPVQGVQHLLHHGTGIAMVRHHPEVFCCPAIHHSLLLPHLAKQHRHMAAMVLPLLHLY